MRICIYMQDISTFLGGIQSVVGLIADRLVKAGHSVTVLCPDSGVDPALRRRLSPEIALVRTNRLGGSTPPRIQRASARLILGLVKYGPVPRLPQFFNPLLKWAFLRRMGSAGVQSFLEDREFDAVIGAGATQSLFVALLADRINARTVGWQHSTFDSYYQSRGRSLYGLEVLAGSSFPDLDTVLVLNSADRLKFDTRLGITSEVFSNPVEEHGNTYRSAPDAKTIVFIGRLSFEIKGLDLLVEAFQRVRTRHPDWMLRIYGDGPDKAKLQQLVSARGLNEGVELMGATQDVAAALSSGSIFAFPSKYEGFGIALVEAMRAGLPSVSFSSDGPRDILSDGVTGFLVDNYDTVAFAERILQLIGDRDLRRSMGQRAAEVSEKYAPARLVPEFVRLIGGD